MVLWEIQIRCHLISSVWSCYICFSGSHVKVPVFCLKSPVKGECFFSLVWSENTVLRRSVHLSGRVLGRDHLRSLLLLFIVQCLGGVKFSDWQRSEQWGNCLDRWCASQIFYHVTVTLKGREKNRGRLRGAISLENSPAICHCQHCLLSGNTGFITLPFLKGKTWNLKLVWGFSNFIILGFFVVVVFVVFLNP